MSRRVALGLAVSFVVASLLARSPVCAEEELAAGHFTLVDEEARVILQTALVLFARDEFIDAANDRYEVVKVVGRTAYARRVERLKPARLATVAGSTDGRLLFPVLAGQEKRIALYHTHSDESYVPTDGAASVPGGGGIIKVGEALRRELRDRGIAVLHDTSTHEPHDAGAYDRSRRTVMRLLRRGPDAVLDIHRDAAPAPGFTARLDGQDVARILLVVGRENPAMQANLGFARRVKAAVDRDHPRLMKGILVSGGKYNQDLFPRSLIVEVGTHQNPRVQAERSMAFFADSVPVAVYGERVPAAGEERARSVTAVGFLILLVLGGGLVYLLLSTGSREELKKKVRNFFWKDIGSLVTGRRGGPEERS